MQNKTILLSRMPLLSSMTQINLPIIYTHCSTYFFVPLITVGILHLFGWRFDLHLAPSLDLQKGRNHKQFFHCYISSAQYSTQHAVGIQVYVLSEQMSHTARPRPETPDSQSLQCSFHSTTLIMESRPASRPTSNSNCSGKPPLFTIHSLLIDSTNFECLPCARAWVYNGDHLKLQWRKQTVNNNYAILYLIIILIWAKSRHIRS